MAKIMIKKKTIIQIFFFFFFIVLNKNLNKYFFGIFLLLY